MSKTSKAAKAAPKTAAKAASKSAKADAPARLPNRQDVTVEAGQHLVLADGVSFRWPLASGEVVRPMPEVTWLGRPEGTTMHLVAAKDANGRPAMVALVAKAARAGCTGNGGLAGAWIARPYVNAKVHGNVSDVGA
ncbi:hypothetical protein [Herbaspirillum sp.]|uniref:hypothetical protein n=1 Tax=Herbaspirillum sp. TaxID=1890675 RepID=UPI000C0FBFF9|nr:hypothetical protein [Herbaspirillum sp.]MBO13900.1 hypothetical protein [Herbaspirillum sp.]